MSVNFDFRYHKYMKSRQKRKAELLESRFLYLFVRKKLFLSALVPLIEHINASGGIDDLGLAGVERVRCVGDLKLHERIFNTVNGDGLLGVGAGAGDEYIFV